MNQKAARKNTRRTVLSVSIALFILLSAAAGAVTIWHYVSVNSENELASLNKNCISVQTGNIVMESETEGTAEIIVELPDYRELYKRASAESDPNQYLEEAFKEKQYAVVEREEKVPVTVENGKQIVHSEEAVEQILEEASIEAAIRRPYWKHLRRDTHIQRF